MQLKVGVPEKNSPAVKKQIHIHTDGPVCTDVTPFFRRLTDQVRCPPNHVGVRTGTFAQNPVSTMLVAGVLAGTLVETRSHE